ncbi:GbsR/MarR family transcriptional regulator [Yinghuangia sp. ASG 101]|uniref:GbsR/MarR family transcriptional regulator n=1 Tax=Yinghuangia sp. ASG 101 TaxID=2896848 RepID=UPI002F90A8EE
MANQDEDAVGEFVERFAGELVDAGMTRMPARVFAAILASDTGVLGSAELAERLRISPAAVSGAVRYLTHVGLVSREREPGSRRERYRVRNDQWYATFARRDQLLVRWEETLRAGVKAVGPDTPAGQRLGENIEFFEFLQEELAGMMERWRARRQRSAEAHEG